MTLNWKELIVADLFTDAANAARERQAQLTKPPGSLGRLEDIAVRLAGMQNNPLPEIRRIQITVFAGDHGIVEEGVSAFPQAVTAEMVRNFARGGAAISVLAREIGADLEVINTGTATEMERLPGVLEQRVAAGTRNFLHQPAMSPEQMLDAMHIGRLAVERAIYKRADLFIAGEMGIGNTTAATALSCALLDCDPGLLTGPGTGLDQAGVAHKQHVIRQALQNHAAQLGDPWSILACTGGFEIAAMAGAFLVCAEKALPFIVDGFIASSAMLTASKINPDVLRWAFFAHASAEPGHQYMLDAMQACPLLDFGMRLGEGSGAATVVPLLKLACALHAQMATFSEAGVSEKI